jgi:hypothetical protein
MSSVACTDSQLSHIIGGGESCPLAETTHKVAPVFKVVRATDASYYGEYAEEYVAHYNAVKSANEPLLVLRIHNDEVRGIMFGLVELMFVFGDYATRKSALNTWYNLKNSRFRMTTKSVSCRLAEKSDISPDPTNEPTGILENSIPPSSGSNSDREIADGAGQFYASLGRTDYCTLADFLDHILDHLTGSVAETIQFARRKTSTMVSTGSDLAIALTEQNAQAIAEAPQDVRQVVEELRDQTEAAAVSKGIVSPPARRVAKERYDKSYGFYIRGFSPLLSERRIAKKEPLRTDNPALSWDVVKFGIAFNIDTRDDKYGQDDGFFSHVFLFRDQKEADHVEKILRAAVKPICLDKKYEYVRTEDLCSLLGVDKPVTPEGYRQLMVRMFTVALRLAHSFYPDMLGWPWPYGRSFDLKEVPSIKAQLGGTVEENGSSSTSAVSMSQVVIKETALTLDMLPDYNSLFPGFGNATSPVPQEEPKVDRPCIQTEALALKMQQEKTKQTESEERQKLLDLLDAGKLTFEQVMEFKGVSSPSTHATPVPIVPEVEQTSAVTKETEAAQSPDTSEDSTAKYGVRFKPSSPNSTISPYALGTPLPDVVKTFVDTWLMPSDDPLTFILYSDIQERWLQWIRFHAKDREKGVKEDRHTPLPWALRERGWYTYNGKRGTTMLLSGREVSVAKGVTWNPDGRWPDRVLPGGPEADYIRTNLRMTQCIEDFLNWTDIQEDYTEWRKSDNPRFKYDNTERNALKSMMTQAALVPKYANGSHYQTVRFVKHKTCLRKPSSEPQSEDEAAAT